VPYYFLKINFLLNVSFIINIAFFKNAKIQLFFKLFNRKFSYSTRLSGGGWAKPKNGVAHFWARVGDAV